MGICQQCKDYNCSAVVVRFLLPQMNTATGRLTCCAGAGVLQEGSHINSSVGGLVTGGLQSLNPTCLALSAPGSAQGAGVPGLGSTWSILGGPLLPEDQLADSSPEHSGVDAALACLAVAARGAAVDFSSTAAAEAVLQALDCWSWQPVSFESSAGSSSTPGRPQHPSPGKIAR